MKKIDLIVVKPNETSEDVYQKFLAHLTKLGIQILDEDDNEKS